MYPRSSKNRLKTLFVLLQDFTHEGVECVLLWLDYVKETETCVTETCIVFSTRNSFFFVTRRTVKKCTQPWQRPVTKCVFKSEAANTVYSSWWWAVFRSKHVEPSKNFGIINSIIGLHLVGYFYWSKSRSEVECADWSLQWYNSASKGN